MALLDRLRQAAKGLALRATLPLLVERRSLPALLASLDRRGSAAESAPGAARAGEEARRLAERLFRPLRFWPTTCLYRALGSYALLRGAGEEVRFVIGVRTVEGRLLAHAWLERDGRAVVGAPAPGETWQVAYAWPADPAMLPSHHGDRPVSGVRRSDDAVLTELKDGTGVLLHLQTRYYFTLNPTGVRVWKLLAEGVSESSALAATLAGEYPEADPVRVRADVDALLADLARESLVTLPGLSAMPNFTLHHLTVQTRSALAFDPGARLLGGFPPAEDWRRPHLTIAFQEAHGTLPAPRGLPILTHGDLNVHLDGEVAVVSGPHSRLRVSPRGDRIDGLLAAGAAEQQREVAEIDLMLALSLALRPLGLHHLHAAATVSPDGKVFLIAGTGGSGKSTLAAILVSAGHSFLGDDTVLVAPGSTLLAFPRPFHLSPVSAEAAQVTSGPPRPGTGKGDLDAAAAFPGKFRWYAPEPDLVLLPRIVDAPVSSLAPAGSSETLGALLALSAFATSPLPGGDEQRARLAAIVDGARALHLALGRDLLEDPEGTVARLDEALATPA